MKKGSNPPGKHNCAIGGGPASKKGNKYGAARRNKKYAAQWQRSLDNKLARIARQARRFKDYARYGSAA